MYDPTEPIPHADTALAPPKSLLVARPLLPSPPPPPPEPVKVVAKGSHPRRTYVGIKARRKRLSGHGDEADDENEADGGGNKAPRESSSASPAGATPSSYTTSTHLSSKVLPVVKKMFALQDPRWRDKIYYLSGGLFINATGSTPKSNKVHVCIKGKWLASLDGQPRKEDISQWSNKNDFYYESLAQEDMSSLALPENCMKPLSGRYTGFHFIDPTAADVASSSPSEGVPTKCTEALLHILFTADPSTGSSSYSLVGKGESDLGKFLLFGTYDSQSRRIEVSRRYVEDSNPCNGYTLPYLQEHFTLGMSSQILAPRHQMSEVAPSQSLVGASQNIAGAPQSVVGTSQSVISSSQGIVGTPQSVIGAPQSIVGAVGASQNIVGAPPNFSVPEGTVQGAEGFIISPSSTIYASSSNYSAL